MLPFRWYRRLLPLWLRSVLFAMWAGGITMVLLPYLALTRGGEWAHVPLGALRFCGLPLVLLGFGGWVRCLWEFAARGRGTPSPLDPPDRLVVTGLYRFVRNPMYVTVGMVVVGEILLLESALLLMVLLFLWLAFHLFVTLYEEPTLRRLFGDPYREYCRSVPRWIPRVRPYHGA